MKVLGFWQKLEQPLYQKTRVYLCPVYDSGGVIIDPGSNDNNLSQVILIYSLIISVLIIE